MVKEHEIPHGSKLYFSKEAKLKREIENKIASFLYKNGFEEIVTPFFSYSNIKSVDDKKKLIRLNDEFNNQITLKYDSTIDVAKIVTKRLGRATSHKKWFYIQPVFEYPTKERYQVGIEWLNEDDFLKIIRLQADILKLLNQNSPLQLCNIMIPKLITNRLNISIDIFKNGDIFKLLKLDVKWLNRLIEVKRVDELGDILDILPNDIKVEAQKLYKISKDIEYENIILSPLYYAKLKYYEDFYFRVIDGNFIISRGGRYKNDGIESIGFSIDVDNLLRIKSE